MAYRAKSIVGAQIPVFRFALLLIVFHIHVHVSASSFGPIPVMAVHVAFHPAQHHPFFYSYTSAADSATHIPERDIALPSSIWRYLFMIFATISSPPEDAFRLNRMLSPTLTTRI